MAALTRVFEHGGSAVVGRGMTCKVNRITARSLRDLGLVTTDVANGGAPDGPFSIALTESGRELFPVGAVVKPPDLEVDDHTNWWVAFPAEGDEATPLAFGRDEAELESNLTARFLRDDPEEGEASARERATTDIVYARCAMRIAWRNDFERAEDEPQIEWLDVDMVDDDVSCPDESIGDASKR
jgi:hypothetical protein